jgi:hypothetical protein
MRIASLTSLPLAFMLPQALLLLVWLLSWLLHSVRDCEANAHLLHS